MTRLLAPLALASTLLACAPLPEGAEVDAEAPSYKSANLIEAVMDVSCADPSCAQLFLDGSQSYASGDGIESYSWTFDDGQTSSEAWAFMTTPTYDPTITTSTGVTFAVAKTDGSSDSVRFEGVGIGPSPSIPDTALVWVKNKMTAAGSCRITMGIGGCLTGVQGVVFAVSGSGGGSGSYAAQSLATSVSPGDTKVDGPRFEVAPGDTVFLSTTKVYNNRQVQTSEKFHCSSGFSKR